MSEQDALIKDIASAWRNRCLESVPGSGDLIAARLTEELRRFPTAYDNDEEAFMVMVQRICAQYTMDPPQMRSLVRNLKADFYRLFTQPVHGLPAIAANSSAFGTMDDLVSALSAGAKQFQQIRSGAAQVPDIDRMIAKVLGKPAETPSNTVVNNVPPVYPELVDVSPDEPPEPAYRLLRTVNYDYSTRVAEIISRHYNRWEDAKMLLRSREVARNIRYQGLARLLEQARIAGCYS